MKAFETIGTAQVAKSAEQAVHTISGPKRSDHDEQNRLLADAKEGTRTS